MNNNVLIEDGAIITNSTISNCSQNLINIQPGVELTPAMMAFIANVSGHPIYEEPTPVITDNMDIEMRPKMESSGILNDGYEMQQTNVEDKQCSHDTPEFEQTNIEKNKCCEFKEQSYNDNLPTVLGISREILESDETNIVLSHQDGISVDKDGNIKQTVKIDPMTNRMVGIPAGANISGKKISGGGFTFFNFGN